jgi:hypothetical protein
MKRASWLLLGAIGLGMVVGCKKPPQSSPEYTEASGSYTTLTATMGDDAYADPGMSRIESLLFNVPPESLDATAARELLAKIGQERARVAAEAAAHKKALEDATKPTVMPDSPPSNEAPEKPVAAGPVHVGIGMTTDEVSRAGGECFHYTQTLTVRNANGSEVDGVIWERGDAARCQEAFPDLSGRMLVFESNKLVQIIDKSQIRHEVLDASVATPAPAPAAPPPGVPPPAALTPEAPKKEPPAPPPAQPPPTPPAAGENTGPAPTE